MSAPNSDGVLTRTIYPFCKMSAVADSVTKSAIGDKWKSQRLATVANVSDRRHQERGCFQRERRFVVTVLSQNSKASPLMSPVFGRMLGY